MPKLEGKKAVIKEIKEKLEKATSLVLVDYRGLTVEQDTELRAGTREEGVDYKVYKNTMLNFALEGTKYEELKDSLKGPTAVAFSYEDPTSGPRAINKVAKDSDILEFKAGIVEGKFYDVEGIKKIANIPAQEELLAKLFASFKSPVTSFALTVKAIAEKKDEEAA